MKPYLITTLAIAVYIPSFFAADTYPAFVRSPVPRFDSPIIDAASDVTALIATKMGRPSTERLEPGPELRLWVQQNRQWMSHQATIMRENIPARTWPLVSIPNRLPLPSVLANNGSGLVPGIDSMWSVHNLADDAKSAKAIIRYGMFWQLVFENDPATAITWLNTKTSSEQVKTADIVELQSTLAYWPGGKLDGPIQKSDWQSLFRSSNILNYFIALEKFDSVEQSPAELLALYRKCLFGACSYLELRALEAIVHNKDFREDVAKMLGEYIKRNPPANDGTLPSLRNNFPSLIEGAKQVIATIRSSEKPAVITPPLSDSSGQTTSTSPSSVTQPAEKNIIDEAKLTSSTLSAIWIVLIGVVIGILWWISKGKGNGSPLQ